jgi:hypothetical protein
MAPISFLGLPVEMLLSDGRFKKVMEAGPNAKNRGMELIHAF